MLLAGNEWILNVYEATFRNNWRLLFISNMNILDVVQNIVKVAMF